MSIVKATEVTLLQLKEILLNIEDEIYVMPIPKLGESSIGQHVRHTLEFYQCLLDGISEGVVNYDKRERNYLLETSTNKAIEVIDDVLESLKKSVPSKSLYLEVCYELDKDSTSTVKTNFSRELIYNIEHAIHHMAIIKIGIFELKLDVSIPEGFGIAVSTLKYKRSLN